MEQQIQNIIQEAQRKLAEKIAQKIAKKGGTYCKQCGAPFIGRGFQSVYKCNNCGYQKPHEEDTKFIDNSGFRVKREG